MTSGIHIWSEIFTHDYEDGRKVAILLVDTQGTFDSRTSMRDCSMIFALSTLLSSVQIYNVMQNIQEDDLQHLQLFSEIGRMAANDRRRPFQNLLFLVRDWNYHQEHAYGLVGGQEFLDERLATSEDQESELRSLRYHLRACFDEMQCFLMPYPGRRVTSDNNFTGQLKEIEEDFVENLKILIPHLLAPENLAVKKINGCPLKVDQFLVYFKRYFEVLTSGDMPRAVPIFEATAEIFNTNAVQESQNIYASSTQNLSSANFRINEAQLRRQHQVAMRDALNRLEERRLMGSDEYIARFKQMLLDFIEAKLRELEQQNQTRPTVSGILSMIVLLAGGFFLGNPAAAAASGNYGRVATYLLAFLRDRPRVGN